MEIYSEKFNKREILVIKEMLDNSRYCGIIKDVKLYDRRLEFTLVYPLETIDYEFEFDRFKVLLKFIVEKLY